LFVTDAVMSGLPPHIAQVICGHRSIDTTMGYKATYPEETIEAHRAWIARRRAIRPSAEYRTPTDAEWEEFLGHFQRRKVSLGTCGRAYNTGCIHEHACIRCPMLRPDPTQRPRLVELRDNLSDRITEAHHEGWLGEIEGLQISLAAADTKLTNLDRLTTPTDHCPLRNTDLRPARRPHRRSGHRPASTVQGTCPPVSPGPTEPALTAPVAGRSGSSLLRRATPRTGYRAVAGSSMATADGVSGPVWWFRRLGAWVSLAAAGFIGVGGGLILSQWLPGPWAISAGGAAAAVSALLADRAKSWAEQQRAVRRDLPSRVVVHGRAGGLPRVRDVVDLILLGVHPAEQHDAAADGAAAELTPYVRRDIDDELRAAVRSEELVIVVGESTAGKSRAMAEAARTQLPDHVLAAPAGRDSITAVSAHLSQLRRPVVLWLDDLERFLGPGGLTPTVVASLTRPRSHAATVLATMRTAEYERFTARNAPTVDTERSAWRDSREVLRAARVITLPRIWSPTELQHATVLAGDPRIARALRTADTFGVAETIAAGPELLRDWHNAWAPGGHPRGAALVTAAVDCRRAGMDGPLPRDLLNELHHHYLAARGGHTLRPEPLQQAWAWAVHPVHGASSLLIPDSPSDNEPGYVAFDYLIDQPDHHPIPAHTWNTLITRADHAQAARIASEAYWRVRTAFHAAVDSGLVDNVFEQAQALADRGEHAQAIQLLTDTLRTAISADEPTEYQESLRHNIAFYQMLAGQLDQAEAAFTQLLAEAEARLPADDEELQVVRHNLASCTRRRGDLAGALAQFQRILTDREQYLGPDAMNTLATRGAIASITAEMGDTAAALRQTQALLADEERALGEDHTNTLATRHSLATYLAQTGDYQAAARALRDLLPDLITALGSDHPDVQEARSDLARYEADDRGNDTPANQRG
jgi:tetratricopeptide (TPR) repeat protein